MIKKKYKANSREDVVAAANQVFADRGLPQDFEKYLQTDDLVHLYYIGRKVIEEGVYDDDGDVVMPPVLSDYVLFDVMCADESQLSYFEGFEEVTPQNPIHEWG